jgi:hypothetical protein
VEPLALFQHNRCSAVTTGVILLVGG